MQAFLQKLTFKSVPTASNILSNEKAAATEQRFLATVTQANIAYTRSMLTRTPGLIHGRNVEGRTALHLAVLADAPAPFVEMLLQRGADPMARDERGNTALHLAAKLAPRHPEMFTQLIAAGGLPLLLSANEDKLDAIGCARQAGHPDITLMLQRRKAQSGGPAATSSRPNAETPLAKPISAGPRRLPPNPVAAVRGASQQCAQPDRTPLMLALERNQLEGAKQLVRLGADINAVSAMKDGDPGMPCLFFAQTPQTMTYMLACGADLFAKSSDGMTALDWIMVSHPRPVAELAMAAAAKQRVARYDIGPALCMALTLRKVDAAMDMLAWPEGALSNQDCDRALSLVAPATAPKLVKALRDRGGNRFATSVIEGVPLKVLADSATSALLQEAEGEFHDDTPVQANHMRPEREQRRARRCCPFA